MTLKTLLFIFSLLPTVLWATERNDLPSCYDFLNLSNIRPESSGRELILIIDETTLLPVELKKSVFNHIMRFMKPGDNLRLYRISAFMPNSFLQLEYAAILESELTGKVRDTVGMSSLRKLDKCLKQQQLAFRNELIKKISASFGNENKEIARSELLFSLQKISQDIQFRNITKRVALIVSDMLENSAFTSFYTHNRIREINPIQELKKAGENHLIANLEGWRIYVEAAGLGPHNAKYGYRSGKTMQRLEQFWRLYFEKSGATLKGFGTPMLTMEIS